MQSEINKITIIGAGTMGNGIAHVFALNNFKVDLFDTEQSALSNGMLSITKNLDRQVKKGTITNEVKQQTLSNIQPINELNRLDINTNLVIEAIVENYEAKSLLFNKLNDIINDNCIFASNTSSISITQLARSSRQDKFIGMHFMNPVPMMSLVEIIKGYDTSEDTFQTIHKLVNRINKVPVLVNDYPGFIANRILMPMINEAIFALYENVASAEDIDTVMKLGMNHPMGPLTLADFIGLDVCLAIMEVLYNGFNDSKYRPCPLLKKMVSAGKLGRKTKKGFFKYE